MHIERKGAFIATIKKKKIKLNQHPTVIYLSQTVTRNK